MSEDVFLLYEDEVHFSLLVDRNEGIHEDTATQNEAEEMTENDIYNWENPANGVFINNLYNTYFPGENTENNAPSFEYTPPLAPGNSSNI